MRTQKESSATIAKMPQTWYLLPDGRYKCVTATEDLMTDMRSVIEDIQETFLAVRAISKESRETRETSRQLIQQSQRARRLRKTALRLVTTASDFEVRNL